MTQKIPLLALGALAFAGPAQAALIYSHAFTDGADSWTMAGGGTMTTGDLLAAFTTTDAALAPLITKPAGDTDARSATLMAWVNLADTPAATNLFTVATRTGGDITNYYGYKLATDGAAAATVTQTANSTGALATLPTTEWVHVALTVEKSATARTATALLYLNGNLWGGQSVPADHVFGTNFNGNGFAELTFGQAGMSAAGLQIYDNVLTGTDIATAFATQTAVPEPSTYGLLGAGALAAAAFVRRRRKGL